MPYLRFLRKTVFLSATLLHVACRLSSIVGTPNCGTITKHYEKRTRKDVARRVCGCNVDERRPTFRRCVG